jgi:hypothetical protein
VFQVKATRPQVPVVTEKEVSAVYARTPEGTWRFLIDGTPLHGTGRLKGARGGDDHVVYDTQEKRYYLCSDFYNKPKDGTVRAAIPAPAGATAVFARSPAGEWRFFVDGESLHGVARTEGARGGDDHYVYDRLYKNYYVCRDFYNVPKDGSLRPAIAAAQASPAAYVRTTEGTWRFYIEGEGVHGIDRMLGARSGEDHVVYDTKERAYYMCGNFYNQPKDDTLRPAVLAAKGTTAVFARTEDGKWRFFLDGVPLHGIDRLTGSRSGDDHIVYDTQQKAYYLCKDFYSLPKDNALHSAVRTRR